MPNDFIDDFFIERIVILVVVFFGGKWLIRKIGERVLMHMEKGGKDATVHARGKTIGSVISTTGNMILYTIAILMLLDALNVKTTAILTGAGLIGLAIGFGSQAIIKDFISGLFVLIEDQYRIGERVKIGALEGDVRKITMRLTTLQGDSGEMHFIPNGTVTGVTNLSREKKGE